MLSEEMFGLNLFKKSTVCSWPIVLIKSDAVFTTEKCAHEIEILNGRTGTRTKISRNSAQNRLLH